MASPPKWSELPLSSTTEHSHDSPRPPPRAPRGRLAVRDGPRDSGGERGEQRGAMSNRTRPDRLLGALAIVVAAVTGCAHGATAAGSRAAGSPVAPIVWAAVTALPLGQSVEVTVATGQRIAGRVESATDVELVVASRRQHQTVPRADVWQVVAVGRRQVGRSVARGIAIGGTFGATIGLVEGLHSRKRTAVYRAAPDGGSVAAPTASWPSWPASLAGPSRETSGRTWPSGTPGISAFVPCTSSRRSP